MNPNIQKIDILCNVTNKKVARHFENHRCMTWRHTGSDQSTNVYPRDGPSLLVEDLEKNLNDAVYSKQRCTRRVILISNKYSKNINAALKTSLRLVSMIIRETKNRAFMECCKRTYINLPCELACGQALLFGRAKRAARERASERRLPKFE